MRGLAGAAIYPGVVAWAGNQGAHAGPQKGWLEKIKDGYTFANVATGFFLGFLSEPLTSRTSFIHKGVFRKPNAMALRAARAVPEKAISDLAVANYYLKQLSWGRPLYGAAWGGSANALNTYLKKVETNRSQGMTFIPALTAGMDRDWLVTTLLPGCRERGLNRDTGLLLCDAGQKFPQYPAWSGQFQGLFSGSQRAACRFRARGD